MSPIKAVVLALAACLLLPGTLALSGVPAQAKGDLPGSADQMQAIIPGTHMTRDEFRARAFAQLNAIALNAHAYFAVNNAFPPSYYDLFNSDAWNLDISNIFSGRTVDAIQFAPKSADLTNAPPELFPLPGDLANANTAATGQPPLKVTGNLDQGLKFDQDALSQQLTDSAAAGPSRVNPAAVQPKTPGAIFYYTSGTALQLLLYAPDGTYMEYYTPAPNTNWMALLNIKANGRSFPADLYANQVLYYLDRFLPRHYNLVRFMAGGAPIPEADLQNKSAAERLKMASDMGITVFNPYTKHAAQIAKQAPKPGELVVDAAKPVPVTMALKSGEVVSFEQLSAGPGGAPVATPVPGQKPAPTKPVKPSGPPPMGGRDMR